MDYQINFGCWGKVFAVPSAVVDHLIKLASESQLKVLLYLLRNTEKGYQKEQIASYFRISEEQVEEAIEFWIQANILLPAEHSSNITANMDCMAHIPSQSPLPPSSAPVTPEVTIRQSSKDLKLDPSEIAKELETSQRLKDLFTCAETSCGRMLNHMEQRSLLWMHNYLGLQSEVILLLLNYCISIDKNSMAYVESIAIRWMEMDITTMEKAEKEIQQMTDSHTFTSKIRKLFQMNRKPTKHQQEYIDQWQSAGYSMELIQHAYEMTIERIDKLDFKYIHKILENWASQGVTTVAQAERLIAANANAKPHTGRKREAPISEKEIQEMDAYLSTVNRFRKE